MAFKTLSTSSSVSTEFSFLLLKDFTLQLSDCARFLANWLSRHFQYSLAPKLSGYLKEKPSGSQASLPDLHEFSAVECALRNSLA